MKLLFMSLFLLGCWTANAQTSPVPDTIPHFKIMLSDGSFYTASDLKAGTKLLVVYFDPECGHCKHFTRDMLKNMPKLKDVQIVMVCAANLPSVKNFVDTFSLNKYSNVKAGTEGIYRTVMYFYHVQITPFAALYNKKGKLITYYRDGPKVEDIIKQFNHPKST